MTDFKNFERFFTKYRFASGGCWEWTASKNRQGYGRMWLNNKLHGAHRASFYIFKGDIPKGLFVCHSCDNPSCVNPNHLWLGTNKENSKDRDKKGRLVNVIAESKKAQTHCINGHEFTPQNTYIKPKPKGNRGCKKCRSLAMKRWYKKKRS